MSDAISIEEALKSKITTITAADLQHHDFPPLRFVVPGLLPAGCILFAGAPKLGKSIWALQLGINIARGDKAFGKLDIDQSDVLVAVLEDGGLRRTQDRLSTMIGDEGWPARLHLTAEMDRLDEGGQEWLEGWLDENPDTNLVVIDTLKRVRPQTGGGGRRHYDEDYEALAALTDLANGRNVSILVVHHTREMKSDDWLDSVSGSRGLTAAVDTILAATRGRSTTQAVLKIVGRDIPEAEWAFEIDFELLSWTLQGDAALYVISEERREILDAFEGQLTMTPAGVAEALGTKNSDPIRYLMRRMVRDGQLFQEKRGLYSLPKKPPHNPHKLTDSGSSSEVVRDVRGVLGLTDDFEVPY
jgi:hypothetical protein